MVMAVGVGMIGIGMIGIGMIGIGMIGIGVMRTRHYKVLPTILVR